MAQPWEPGPVTAMLERAGEDACRPQNLPAQFGLREGRYYLSEDQAQAILDLRLQKLTGLETDKIIAEYRDIIETIGELLEILNNPERLLEVIREELEEVRREYGDARRTEIVNSKQDLTYADLRSEERRVGEECSR